MMTKIEKPLAAALVRWRSAEQGGRRSGPPNAPVYMATSGLAAAGGGAGCPNWSASVDMLSILLQKTAELADGRWRCLVGFLVPELARPHLARDTEILVLEGAKVVATATVLEVFDE